MPNINETLLIGNVQDTPVAVGDVVYFSLRVSGRERGDDLRIGVQATTSATHAAALKLSAGDIIHVVGELHNCDEEGWEIYVRAMTINRRDDECRNHPQSV